MLKATGKCKLNIFNGNNESGRVHGRRLKRGETEMFVLKETKEKQRAEVK